MEYLAGSLSTPAPAVDRGSSIRAAIGGFREHHVLPMVGVVVAPFVIAGYVGLTALFLLPLLGLRTMFPRRWTGARIAPNPFVSVMEG